MLRPPRRFHWGVGGIDLSWLEGKYLEPASGAMVLEPLKPVNRLPEVDGGLSSPWVGSTEVWILAVPPKSGQESNGRYILILAMGEE